MIITKITGGLGNQMFQYAAGYALAEKNETEIELDLRSYRNNTHRAYELDQLGVKTKEAPAWKIMLYKYLGFSNVFNKPDFHFQPEFFNLPKNTYLDGYFQNFQSEKYFKNYFEDVRKMFKKETSIRNKYPDLINKITGSNSVSIHIRRGDYLNKLKTYNILDQEYYKKAQELIEKSVENPVYFIWSDDDIEWAEKNISAKNKFIVSGQNIDGIDDMQLMSLCKHNIIANSSFSWWAAWLNNNKEKIVIAPNKWFSKVDMNTKDLIPETWKKI